MTWLQLLTAHRVQPHATSRQELDGLWAVVARDLTDARVPGLSTDRKFATAYNTVLQLAKMAIACAGYRIVGQGHHLTTFEALELAMGRSIASLRAISKLIAESGTCSTMTWRMWRRKQR
jgi:hypothetical protein